MCVCMRACAHVHACAHLCMSRPVHVYQYSSLCLLIHVLSCNGMIFKIKLLTVPLADVWS